LSATSKDSLFIDGKIDEALLRRFVQQELKAVNAKQKKEIAAIEAFIVDIFGELDVSYELLAKPMIYSMLYKYVEHKDLVVGLFNKLKDAPEKSTFSEIFSEILLAGDVVENIAKHIVNSTTVDPAIKAIPEEMRKKIDAEWAISISIMEKRVEEITARQEEIKGIVEEAKSK
jgi:hypothetical protein